MNRAERALEALDEELDRQEQLVADHRKTLQSLLAEHGISILPDEQPFTSEPGEDSVEISLRQHTYSQAREHFDQSRAMLREMKIKQEESRILLKKPRDPITIHKPAD